MQNVRIEIVSASVTTMSGKSRKTGNDYTMHRQEGYLHNGHAYPERFEFSPPTDGEGKPLGYRPGFYTLAPAAIRVSRETGGIEINRFDELKLLELPADQKPQK